MTWPITTLSALELKCELRIHNGTKHYIMAVTGQGVPAILPSSFLGSLQGSILVLRT